VQDISPEELQVRLAAGEALRLLDVREEREWAICRLPGAELRPLSRLQEWIRDLDPEDGPFVLYCHHGVRSRHAGRLLERLGARQVLNLAGGIDAWRRRVDPEMPRY